MKIKQPANSKELRKKRFALSKGIKHWWMMEDVPKRKKRLPQLNKALRRKIRHDIKISLHNPILEEGV